MLPFSKLASFLHIHRPHHDSKNHGVKKEFAENINNVKNVGAEPGKISKGSKFLSMGYIDFNTKTNINSYQSKKINININTEAKVAERRSDLSEQLKTNISDGIFCAFVGIKSEDSFVKSGFDEGDYSKTFVSDIRGGSVFDKTANRKSGYILNDEALNKENSEKIESISADINVRRLVTSMSHQAMPATLGAVHGFVDGYNIEGATEFVTDIHNDNDKITISYENSASLKNFMFISEDKSKELKGVEVVNGFCNKGATVSRKANLSFNINALKTIAEKDEFKKLQSERLPGYDKNALIQIKKDYSGLYADIMKCVTVDYESAKVDFPKGVYIKDNLL